MARPYGQKFLLALNRSQEDTLGVQLAKLCVKANLPATLVAAALKTSPTTVYAWFRGQGVRERNRKVVEAFISLLRTDFQKGYLPVNGNAEASRYISDVLGISVDKKR